MQIVTDGAGPSGPSTRPLEPRSGFWLSDHPGRDGDGNGRWLPAGADTATAQPEQGSTEHQAAAPGDTGSSPRRRAVEAYCAEICLSEEGPSAAAETLDAFAGGDDHDLLRTARARAAKRANPIPEELRGWRNVSSAQRMGECTSTPAFLAARDNDQLSGEETLKLEDHLESCVTCQALELRSQRAERTFAAIMGMTPLAAGAGADGEGPSPTTETPIAPAEAHPAPESGPLQASGWVPAELASAPAVAAPAAPIDTVSTPVAEPHGSSRRRRGIILGAATAVAAAAIAAGVLLTSGSSNGVSAPRTNIAAKATVTAAARHRAAKRAAAARGHHASHAATHAAAATPGALASAAQAPQASPAPANSPSTSPSAPSSSGSGGSAPGTSANTPASTTAPPQSGASFHQPSLAATNAPQGIGPKH